MAHVVQSHLQGPHKETGNCRKPPCVAALGSEGSNTRGYGRNQPPDIARLRVNRA